MTPPADKSPDVVTPPPIDISPIPEDTPPADDTGASPPPASKPEDAATKPVAPKVPPPQVPVETKDEEVDVEAKVSEAWWRKINIVAGYGYTALGTSVKPDAEPFASTVGDRQYRGHVLELQPSYTVFKDKRWDVRVGADFRFRFMSLPNDPGVPESSLNSFSISPMAEANVSLHEYFGIGANFALGYQGIWSSDVDVGAPYSASFDWGSDGGLFLGGQLYLTTLEHTVRLGVAVNGMPTELEIETGQGNPALTASLTGPTVTPFLGVDIMGIVRQASK